MNQAIRALARSYRAERVVTGVIGGIAVLLGAAALVVGTGWLGTYRAGRPVLDPIAVDTIADFPMVARIVAIVVGVTVFVVGLVLFTRTLRPEHHPDLALDPTLTVTATAIADAIGADAEQIDGVSRAKATVVGEPGEPALRLRLWLREGTSVKTVWQELDGSVLRRARESLGVEHLPTAVRLELGAAQRQRVR